MLTDNQASAAQAADRDYKLADANGLYLFVTRSGFKSWRMKYRFGGKEKRLTFGAYPDVSLEEARARRDEARRMLRAQIDPAAERQKARAAGVAAPIVDEPDDEAQVDAPTDAPVISGSATSQPPPSIRPSIDPVPPARTAPFAAATQVAPAALPEAAPSAPVGSRALSLLREAEVARDAATAQARTARRIGYAIVAMLLVAAILVLAWLLVARHRADQAVAPAIVAAAPVTLPAAAAPAVATPDLSATAAAPPPTPPATPTIAAGPSPAPVASSRPITVTHDQPAVAARHHGASSVQTDIRPAAAPRVRPAPEDASSAASRAAGTITVTAPNDAAPPSRGPQAPVAAPLDPPVQEKAYVAPIAPGATNPIDPALDRVGRAALCLRAAYHADASCVALRGAGG